MCGLPLPPHKTSVARRIYTSHEEAGGRHLTDMPILSSYRSFYGNELDSAKAAP